MREGPILFNAPMARATLTDRKNQTRRIMKLRNGQYMPPSQRKDPNGWAQMLRLCPYGQPGERLWGKENYRTYKGFDHESMLTMQERLSCNDYEMRILAPIHYEADGGRRNWNATDASPGRLRPSIHMPRWASRMTLEVLNVRVERLQDISEEDAVAEGIEKTEAGFWSLYGQAETDGTYSPIASYRALWSSINGPESWDANPLVWAVNFKRIEP